MWGQPVIGPADVSFLNIQLKETRGTTRGTGEALQHLNGVIHADTPAWVGSRRVSADGTLMDAADKVWAFFIQREMCGLRSQKDAIRRYAIPPEVIARLGVVRRKP